MQLTRNNYEEYFLLYADGELSGAEKAAVEHFVKLHPDLGDELEMLMETVLKMDSFTEMPGKHLLLKPVEWEEEKLTPLQQSLLLYVDNELPESNKLQLEKQIEKDSLLQADYQSLVKTRLTAEAIEMPDKESLYRHERDRKPIPMMWVRWMAAAAVVTGIGWYILAGFNSSRITTGDVASTTKQDKANGTVLPKTTQVTSVIKDENGTQNTTEKIDGVTNTDSKTAANPATGKDRKQGNTNRQNQEAPVVQTIPQQEIARVELPRSSRLSSGANAATPIIDEPVTIAVNNTENPNASSGQFAQNNTNIAQPAVYYENAIEEPEYVNIGGARIKKQKLRGLLRNVTRTVGRTFDKSTVAQVEVASL